MPRSCRSAARPPSRKPSGSSWATPAWWEGTARHDREGAGDVPDSRLPAPHLAGARAALQVPPVLLRLRAAGHQDLRHTARRRAGGLAAPALQPVEPRRLRPRRAATSLRPSRGSPLMTLPVANVLQPLIDV